MGIESRRLSTGLLGVILPKLNEPVGSAEVWGGRFGLADRLTETVVTGRNGFGETRLTEISDGFAELGTGETWMLDTQVYSGG